MADDRVEVSITANAAGVQTGAQQAAQSLGQVRASAQQLRDALAATGNNLEKATALLAAQGDAAKMAATSNLAAATSMKAATEATGGLRVGTAGVTQEFVRLGRAFATGRMSYVPSELMTLTSRMGGLQYVSLGLLAAVAAAGIAIYSLGRYAYEAAQESDKLSGAMNLIGRSADFAAAEANVERLRQGLGVGRSEAYAAAQAIEAIPVATDKAREALERYTVLASAASQGNLSAAQTGKMIAEAAEKGAAGVESLGEKWGLVFTPAQQQALTAAKAANDTFKAQDILITALAARFEPAAAHVKSYADAWTAAMSQFNWAMSEGMGTASPIGKVAPLVTGPGETQQSATIAAAQKIADGLDRAGKESSDLRAQITQLQGGITALGAAGDTAVRGHLVAALDDAKQKLANLGNAGGGSQLMQWRTQLDQQLAASDTNRKQQLQQEVAFWTQKQALAGNDAKLETAVAGELARARIALNNEEMQENKRALQQEVRDEDEAARQKRQIRRMDADTGLEISRINIDAKKQVLQQEVTDHQITASQEIAGLRQLVEEEYQLNLQSLNNELSTLTPRTTAYARTHDEIRLLKAKNVEDLAALDRQVVASSNRAAQQDARGWREAIGEITSFESSLTRDVLSGRQKLGTSLIQLSSQVVEKEIADDLKYYTMHALYNLLNLSSDKVTEQGGLLVHLLSESQKTAATVAGNATRTAVDQSSGSSFITMVGKLLASWLGFETTKTAATTAGDAAAIAPEVARGMAELSIQASVAAGAAFADTASLGPEGLVAAPAAAAAAYGTVLGWGAGMGGGVGLAVGAWEIPGTMAATLHQGEMVVPQTFAAGLRSAMPGGGGIGGGMGIANSFNIQAVDAKSLITALRSPQVLQALTRSISATLVNNPSLRGGY